MTHPTNGSGNNDLRRNDAPGAADCVPEIDATPKPDAPKLEASEVGAPRRRGAQPGNGNAIRSSRATGRLSKDCRYIERRLREILAETQEALCRVHGEPYPPELDAIVDQLIFTWRTHYVACKRSRHETNPNEQRRWDDLANQDLKEIRKLKTELGIGPPMPMEKEGQRASGIVMYIPDNGRDALRSKPLLASELPPMPQPDPMPVQQIKTQQTAPEKPTTHFPFLNPSTN